MSARVTKSKLRALALVLVAGVAIYTISAFYLADTGTNTLSIQPPAGIAANGKTADFTALSSSITRPNGAATIQAGLLLGRVIVTQGYADHLKVDVAWLDPNDASQVLDNPNVQIYAALYHPIAEGNSACGSTNPQVADTLIDVTDSSIPGVTGSSSFCAHVDANATGSMITSGKLILSATSISGYLKAAASDTGVSSTTCTATVPGGDTWCHPSGLNANQNVLWVALTIVTPGGKPAGQQNNLSSLSFYTGVSTLS